MRGASSGTGAMQSADVFGPPNDRARAIEVLQEAVARGVDPSEPSDFYGPHITNQIIRVSWTPTRPASRS